MLSPSSVLQLKSQKLFPYFPLQNVNNKKIRFSIDELRASFPRTDYLPTVLAINKKEHNPPTSAVILEQLTKQHAKK